MLTSESSPQIPEIGVPFNRNPTKRVFSLFAVAIYQSARCPRTSLHNLFVVESVCAFVGSLSIPEGGFHKSANVLGSALQLCGKCKQYSDYFILNVKKS